MVRCGLIGTRRVLARQGWAGEKSGLLSILNYFDIGTIIM
jgi:hypothetical protein